MAVVRGVVSKGPGLSGPRLVVSVHDVAPGTASAARRWTEVLAPLRVPVTFLVVPGPWRGARFGDVGDDGLDLAAWLRSRQQGGDEISVHGWAHRADVGGRLPRRLVGSVVARGAAELWALDRETAAARTAAGIAVLDRHGLVVSGATPPGWLASAGARAGVADVGLQYVTDHLGMLDLVTGIRWWAPALCHRPVAGAGAGPDPAVGSIPRSVSRSIPASISRSVSASVSGSLERAGRRMVGFAGGLVRLGCSVRVGLHPADLDRPALVDATVDAVRGCLAAGAVPMTYAQVLSRLRAGGR